MLVLSGHDVRALLPYAECADLMRAALAGLARGEIQQPLRTVVRPDGAAGFMALMPSYAAGPGYGLKAICITPGNPARGLDTHQGGVLLFAPDTGEPLAIVNASALTEIRTAAVSAVATGLLARAEVLDAAIVGTGVQGFAHARALAATRPGCRIRMAGRTASWPSRVRQEAEALGVTLVPSVGEALAGAGIVVTATSSREPVLRREWLAPGVHINAVGACVPGDREIDTATMADAAIFADRRDSLHNEAGDFLLARRDGADIEARAELGELLTGAAPGRRDDAEITLFKSLGLAAEDLAAAGYAYRAAVEAGAGTTADF